MYATAATERPCAVYGPIWDGIFLEQADTFITVYWMADEAHKVIGARSWIERTPLSNPVIVCAVKTSNGRHCQESPRHVVSINGGDGILLCPRCYENACKGVYGDVSIVPLHELAHDTQEDQKS